MGAAWTAPAIVIASAAPAAALSGPANVVTVISPPTRNGPNLTVNLQFTNRNTGSTGLMTCAVYFDPTIGTVQATAPTINALSTAGWTYNGTGGISPERSFSFSRPAPGIPGAATATGTGPPITLNITVKVDPVQGAASAGTIRTLNVVSSGNMTAANSAWV